MQDVGRAWDLAIRRSCGAQTAFSLGTAGSGETDPGRFEFGAVSFLQSNKAQSIVVSQISLHVPFDGFFFRMIGSAFFYVETRTTQCDPRVCIRITRQALFSCPREA